MSAFRAGSSVSPADAPPVPGIRPKWLVEKTHAHVEDGRLVPDSADGETLFASLGSAPIHVGEGDRFHAEPRRDIPESDKPTPAMRRARLANVERHKPPFGTMEGTGAMIRKLPSGEYQLYSRNKNPRPAATETRHGFRNAPMPAA